MSNVVVRRVSKGFGKKFNIFKGNLVFINKFKHNISRKVFSKGPYAFHVLGMMERSETLCGPVR